MDNGLITHAVLESLAGTTAFQRDRALARVAEVIAREASTTNRWKPKPSAPDISLHVEIALWEKDIDAKLLDSVARSAAN